MQTLPNVMFKHIQVKKKFKSLDNLKGFIHLDKGAMP